jgi:acyl-CoA synthetase (AMP-forming)/AMP-acid ligase II/pimeloyl-ACP methyl ester carboxylesterase
MVDASWRELYPFESHFIEIDGVRLHYLDEGVKDGPVVLLLHGNPTWSFYFRELIISLKKHYRVIAPDHIGCGLSDHPRDKHYRAIDRVSHVEQLLAELKIDKFSLVVHDWGGPIGTYLATKNSERISNLVFLNTTLYETESLPLIIKRAAHPLIGKVLTKYTRNFIEVTTRLGVARALPANVKAGYFYPYRSIGDRTAIWDFVADIPFNDAHPTYSAMRDLKNGIAKLSNIPSLIIWGLQDPCFHQTMLAHVIENFPKSKVIEIPKASHLVLEDAPEIVIPAIKQFLSGVQSATDLNEAQIAKRETTKREHALYAAFKAFAKRSPSTPAVIEASLKDNLYKSKSWSYQELLDLTARYERGLIQLGLEAGDRILFLLPPSIEFLALSYAVMGRGGIPVFVDPGVGRENIFRCIGDCKPAGFIGSPKAHLLRLLRKELFSNLKFAVWGLNLLLPRLITLSLLKRFSTKHLDAEGCDEVGLVAFTSGATGAPKGVVFTQEMLTEQLRIFTADFGLSPRGKDLPLLPIFSLYDCALGITTVLPPLNPSKPLELNPEEISEILEREYVSSSFGSPTLWGKISKYAEKNNKKYPHLKNVFMAGAPVTTEILNRVQSLLPNGKSSTPYGATEALPATLVYAEEMIRDFKEADSSELGTYVGKAVSGVKIRVIEISRQSIEDISETKNLPAGKIGEVIVSGRNISPSYLDNSEGTRRAKIKDGKGFWHRMGDVGYLDEEGGLYFCGRLAHTVFTPEKTLYPIPAERIFLSHPKVNRTALVSLKNSREAGIVVEPKEGEFPQTTELKERFIDDLKKLAQGSTVTSTIKHFFFHKSFPVDGRHNAKIFRDQLSVWADNVLAGKIKE